MNAHEAVVYLCPSDRAARAFSRRLGAGGGIVVPECLEFERFCRGLWSRGRLFGLIDDERDPLDARTVAAIWRQIVAQDRRLSPPEVSRIATLAGEAWTIAWRHDLPLRQIAAYSDAGGNLALFAEYCSQLHERLQQLRGLTPAELPTALESKLSQLQILLPRRIVMTPAFTSSPARERLFRRIADLGVTVEHWAGHTQAPPRAKRFASADDEMQAAIDWAVERVREGAREAAIVVPDLASRRGEWTTALRQGAGVEQWFLDPAADRDHFNLSIGLPLAEFPYVATVLTVLRAAHGEVATEQLMQALLHPRWGLSARDQSACQRHGVTLLEQGSDRTRLSSWWPVLPSSAPGGIDFNPSRALPRQVHAAAIAKLVGALTSREFIAQTELYQLDEAWSALMQAWVALDRWLPAIGWHAAVRELGEAAGEQLFQPVAGRGGIQVIGLLESAGVPLDAAWITGLNDQTLPERRRPNPMLPLAWQAAQRVGLGSRDEVDARADRLWANWHQLCPDLVVSFAADVAGQVVRESPLIGDCTLQIVSVRNPAATPGTALQTMVDESLPPPDPASGRKLSARALEDQARCPRRAAAVRLGLQEWPEHASGIPARVRGTLVHEVMAAIGRRRIAQGGSEAPLAELLAAGQEVLAQALARERLARPQVPALVWDIEQARVDSLLRRVLALESGRHGFAVEAVESAVAGALDGAQFSLRADRIDRATAATSGTTWPRIVFDYKTGAVARKDWLAETSSGRLAAPQLPLYALLLTAQEAASPVRAIAYIVVSDDECKFVAIGEDESNAGSRVAKNDPPWDDLVTSWRAQIGALIDERWHGVAEVAPLKGRATCRHCGFGPFCREPWSLAGDDEAATDPREVNDG